MWGVIGSPASPRRLRVAAALTALAAAACCAAITLQAGGARAADLKVRVHYQHELQAHKRRLVVHIGPHKTSSSYFQHFAQQKGGLSPTLQWPEVCGKHVQHKGFAGFAKHVCLSSGGKKAGDSGGGCSPDSGRFLESIKQWGAGTRVDLLISAEDFSLCDREGFSRLRAMFEPEFQVEVLVVRRDPRSLLLSRYSENNRYKPATANLTESLPQLRKRARLCSFAGAECLATLVDTFGAGRVHVVSYEGLLRERTDLFDEACRIFSRPRGSCHRRAEKNIFFYRSKPYSRYSATVIFNRLAQGLRCSGGGDGGEEEVAQVSQKNPAVDAFMAELKRAGVNERCFPVAQLPSLEEDCPGCAEDAIAGGELGVRGYRFQAQGRRQGLPAQSKVCHYDEAAALQNQEELRRAIRRLGCPEAE